MLSPHAAAPLAVACVVVAVLFAAASVSASRAPQGSSFTFTAVGDFGKNANTDGVLNGIAASGSQFHIALGDLATALSRPRARVKTP